MLTQFDSEWLVVGGCDAQRKCCARPQCIAAVVPEKVYKYLNPAHFVQVCIKRCTGISMST